MNIIELAKEAGIEKLHIKREGQKHSILDLCYPELERFAALVRAEALEEANGLLDKIESWAKAYPVSVFPEPDFAKAHKVLTENGMTLDAISASNMRHVLAKLQEMVAEHAAAIRGLK